MSSSAVHTDPRADPRGERQDSADQAARLRRLVEEARLAESGGATLVPPSTPTGSVSFRPRPARPVAPRSPVVVVPAGASAGGSNKRTAGGTATAQSVRAGPPAPAPAPRLARAIAVTSGKGGVGKSNLAVNLAVALSGLGRKVCLLDADLGLANADVLCGLTPKTNLQHVVSGRCRLSDVMMLGPGGFRLIPGASGVSGMADLRSGQRRLVLDQLAALERMMDVIIIDCAAGVSSNVLAFAAAAHTTLVTTTPEPTAVTDAYGMVKCLLHRMPRARVRLVVNMVESAEEARGVFTRMNRVTEAFLRRSIAFGAAIPLDPEVAMAVRYRLPFTLSAPDCAATRAVGALARRLAGMDDPNGTGRERTGFFARLAGWFGGSDAGDGDR